MHDTFILALMGLLTFAIISADDKDSAPSLRQTIFGTYENRIREMSAPEKVFDYFASVKRGNEKLMTPFDFIRAITPYNFRADTPVGAGTKIAKSIEQAQEIPEFFKLIDADGDGYISYGEFIFFTTLLAIPERYFYIAFQVIDENGDGRIDQTEFKKMMYSFRRQTPAGAAQRSHDAQVDNAPILPVFFGKDGTRSLRYSIFAEFLRQLRNNVLRLEFDQIDFNKSGSISARDFAMSILAYGNIRNLQQYHERAERLKDRPERITFDEYASFQKVLTNIDDINVAIEMFLEMGEPFTKYDLKRAAKAVASVELSEPSLDLLFFMFDENGDGRLNYDEFVGVLKGRASHGLNKPRDLGVVRFVDCFKQCWSSELGADSRAAKLPKERVPATK